MSRLLRKFRHVIERTIPFVRVCLGPDGLIAHEGRLHIWGKFRRLVQSAIPGYPQYLRRKHGITGGCTSCGASCNLMFRCPHWDSNTRLCTVYEDRPKICKTFPMTPADIRDRNMVLKNVPCGFQVK